MFISRDSDGRGVLVSVGQLAILNKSVSCDTTDPTRIALLNCACKRLPLGLARNQSANVATNANRIGERTLPNTSHFEKTRHT